MNPDDEKAAQAAYDDLWDDYAPRAHYLMLDPFIYGFPFVTEGTILE